MLGQTVPPAVALTLCASAGSHPTQDPGPPPRSRAAWLDPPGIQPTPFPDGAWRARYRGPVHGAWGGSCAGRGVVTTATMAFHADLRLGAGDAINAALRGGGHGLDWVCIDDPDADTGSAVPADLHLWLAGELRGETRPPRGWGADAGGAAFVASEDGERRPLGLRLRLDTQHAGPQISSGSHRLTLPNRCWTLLPSRFAARIHTSLDQALHWMVGAHVRLAPAGGVKVRLRVPAAAPPAR